MTNDNMIKYSAGYIKLNPNFVIQNIAKGDKTIKYYSAFSVVHNILTRGCPTIPSRRLRSKIKDYKKVQDEDFEYILNFDDLKWDNTIKGGDDKNPALDFYETQLLGIPGIKEEYVGSFIPECSIKDISYKKSGDKDLKSDVDFYSPIYQNVIEIDGYQHELAPQHVRDKRREEHLRDAGIEPIRIPVSKMDTKDIRLHENKKYTKHVQIVNPNEKYINNDDGFALYAIRIQLLLIDLYANGSIPLEQEELTLNIHTDSYLGKDNATLIVDDFYDLLTNVLTLQNIEFTRPKVTVLFWKPEILADKDDGINVDISLAQVYCEHEYDDNIIYIRNDYFLYQEDRYFSEKDKAEYLYKKNYYEIKYSEVNYSLDKDDPKIEETLTNLLSDTSEDYTHFKDNQYEIIVALLNNKGAFGVLPTGAGKSLCYQLSSLLIPAMTMVVEPLQLLMTDQARGLNDHFGINNVAVINSKKGEEKKILSSEQALITIVSPERFLNREFGDILKGFMSDFKVGFLVVDEIHCLSEWGHDFRTSYLCLSHNLELYFLSSHTYLLALTGTASYDVYNDVQAELSLFKEDVLKPIFAKDMHRPNLNVIVEQVGKNEKYIEKLEDIVKKEYIDKGQKDKMLVFTKTVGLKESDKKPDPTGCETIKKKLEIDFDKYDLTETIDTYYGGSGKEVLNEFASGQKKIIIATKAFGMGVDIPDIRTTVHYGIPSSLESLYQEMGRAGRDGYPSTCYVLYKKEDQDYLEQFFNGSLSLKEIENEHETLNELSTNFYFITTNNLDPEVEKALIILVKDTIIKAKNEHPNHDGKVTLSLDDFLQAMWNAPKDSKVHNIVSYKHGEDWKKKYREDAQGYIEKAIYRLFLLKEISMWNVVYSPDDLSNPSFTDLYIDPMSEEKKLTQLEKHMERYPDPFSLDGKENTFENRLDALISWTNNHFLKSRINSIHDLYNLCLGYQNSDEFMDYIVNYFTNDTKYSNLIEDSNHFLYWVDALKDSPKFSQVQIIRLLDDYNDLPSINYVSGITELRLDSNKFKTNPNGKERLLTAFKYAEENFSDWHRHTLFNRTYELLEDQVKEDFVHVWLEYFSYDDAYIYDKIKKVGDKSVNDF